MTLTLSSSFDVRVPPHHLTFPGDRVFLPGIKLLQSFRVQLIASLPGDAAFATFDGGKEKPRRSGVNLEAVSDLLGTHRADAIGDRLSIGEELGTDTAEACLHAERLSLVKRHLV